MLGTGKRRNATPGRGELAAGEARVPRVASERDAAVGEEWSCEPIYEFCIGLYGAMQGFWLNFPRKLAQSIFSLLNGKNTTV
jgi:hypothetical protein